MWTNIFLFLLTIGTIQHRSTSISIDCATRVQICPIEKDDWVQKNDQLKCATNYGYVCLRGWTGYLYESCIANFTIQAKIGNCPILYACFDNKPYLGAENTYYGCPKEVSGCPAKNHPEYSIHQLYKYPKCLESNFSDEKENTSQRLTEFNSTTTISTGHITGQKNRHVTIVILTSALPLIFVGCFTFYIVYARKKYARKICHDYTKVAPEESEDPPEELLLRTQWFVMTFNKGENPPEENKVATEESGDPPEHNKNATEESEDPSEELLLRTQRCAMTFNKGENPPEENKVATEESEDPPEHNKNATEESEDPSEDNKVATEESEDPPEHNNKATEESEDLSEEILYTRRKRSEDDKSKDLLRSVLQSLNESDPEEDQILPLKGDDKRKEDRIHVPEEVGIVKKIRSTKPTDRQTLSNIKPDKTLNLRPGKEPRDAGYRKTVQTIAKYWKAETSKEVNDNKVIKTKNTKNRSKRKIKRQQAKRL